MAQQSGQVFNSVCRSLAPPPSPPDTRRHARTGPALRPRWRLDLAAACSAARRRLQAHALLCARPHSTTLHPPPSLSLYYCRHAPDRSLGGLPVKLGFAQSPAALKPPGGGAPPASPHHHHHHHDSPLLLLLLKGGRSRGFNPWIYSEKFFLPPSQLFVASRLSSRDSFLEKPEAASNFSNFLSTELKGGTSKKKK